MDNPSNLQKFPLWAKLMIIISAIPIITLPYTISQCNDVTYEFFKIFFFLYPIYVIISAIMSWICYKSRHEISIVLIILMLLTHIAIWMIPNYGYNF